MRRDHMSTGFHIKALRIAGGHGAPAAELHLRRGGNVVSGASNTGKSYILDCIDYMFGRRDLPRTIPEAAGYSAIYLEIETYGGSPLTLERSLLGGAFKVYPCKLADVGTQSGAEYSAQKRKGRTDSISVLLLGLAGLQDQKLLLKMRGETRDISFRDLARLVLVDEKRIIQQGSPLHSGDSNARAAEDALFRLLITGTDYSSVVAAPDPKLEKARREGTAQVIEQMLESTTAQFQALSVDPDTLPAALASLEQEFEALTKHASVAEGELRRAEEQRARAFSLLRGRRARRTVINELRSRFGLLDEQYVSDLKRLGASLETDYVFSQLPVERCPLCGGPLPSASHGHDADVPDASFAMACRAEIRKIEALRAELAKTSKALAVEDAGLSREVAEDEQRVTELSAAITDKLNPIRTGTARSMKEVAERRASLERGATLVAQANALKAQLEAVGKVPKRRGGRDESKTLARASTGDTDAFCRTVEGLLREWRYPGLDRVTFSEAHQDLVISGKDRESQGKGLRAVAYAGFAIGLMRYCRERGLPHPGIVVLDSPLVTYRRPDVGAADHLPSEVKEAFFESLTKLGEHEQVLVLENDDPPLAVRQRLNWTHFSGSPEVGRQGFYPRVQMVQS